MRNKDKWIPSKFVHIKGKLVASRDPKDLRIGSRLSTHLVAGFYDTHIKNHVKGRLVDLGCGKVPLYEAYRDYVTVCVCVDWKNTWCENDFLDLRCDLTDVLPFRDKGFDTIILSDVLEHIPQPELL